MVDADSLHPVLTLDTAAFTLSTSDFILAQILGADVDGRPSVPVDNGVARRIADSHHFEPVDAGEGVL
jgi:hypothetical protein